MLHVCKYCHTKKSKWTLSHRIDIAIASIASLSFSSLSSYFPCYAHLCPFKMQFMGVSRLSECDISCMYIIPAACGLQNDDPADSSNWIADG